MQAENLISQKGYQCKYKAKKPKLAFFRWCIAFAYWSFVTFMDHQWIHQALAHVHPLPFLTQNRFNSPLIPLIFWQPSQLALFKALIGRLGESRQIMFKYQPSNRPAIVTWQRPNSPNSNIQPIPCAVSFEASFLILFVLLFEGFPHFSHYCTSNESVSLALWLSKLQRKVVVHEFENLIFD